MSTLTVRDRNRWAPSLRFDPWPIIVPSGNTDQTAYLLAQLALVPNGAAPDDPNVVHLSNSTPGVASRIDGTVLIAARSNLNITVPDPSQKFLMFTDKTGPAQGLSNKAANCTISAGSLGSFALSGGSTISATSGADVGGPIYIPGAGPGGAPLVTTIATRADSTHGTLATPASQAVTGAACTFSDSTRPHVAVRGCSYVTVQHFSVSGPNTVRQTVNGTLFAKTNHWLEPEAGITFASASDHCTVSDLYVENVWGDCVNCGPPSPRPTNVTAAGIVGRFVGRHGIGLTNVNTITVSDYDIRGCAQSGCDIESNSNTLFVGGVTLLRGSLSQTNFDVTITGSNSASVVGDVTVDTLSCVATGDVRNVPNLVPNFAAGNLILRNYHNALSTQAEACVGTRNWASVDVENCDVACKGQTLICTNGQMTAGDATKTLHGSGFTSVMASTNVHIRVTGAGPGGADLLTAIITYVNSTTVTVGNTASTTVTGASVSSGAFGIQNQIPTAESATILNNNLGAALGIANSNMTVAAHSGNTWDSGSSHD